ncbi:MAG: prepilin-type N-terminal cleavage/methylation domain-containing protein [Sedimentisphaerales bacterium]|nr:prepilin-type N-terminal cleavage/methylation domain-containing protein [Sedimentisphaerales bacterium]
MVKNGLCLGYEMHSPAAYPVAGLFFPCPDRRVRCSMGRICKEKRTSRIKRDRFRVAILRIRGFTLVELLIVVVLLGLLASIVIPQFSTATVESRENMMRENLRIMRNQIGTYHIQHWDVAPGYDADGIPGEQAFIDQMTLFTDEDGVSNDVASARFHLGPYMTEIPENPVNGLSSIAIILDAGEVPDEPTDNTGWIYKPAERIFKANASGTDINGKTYYDY